MTVAGLGSVSFGLAVPVGVCVGVFGSSFLGVFRAGPGVAPRGGGWLGNEVRWRRRWLGGQAPLAVLRAGPLGCCGCHRRWCVDACEVARVFVCAGLGFG